MGGKKRNRDEADHDEAGRSKLGICSGAASTKKAGGRVSPTDGAAQVVAKDDARQTPHGVRGRASRDDVGKLVSFAEAVELLGFFVGQLGKAAVAVGLDAASTEAEPASSSSSRLGSAQPASSAASGENSSRDAEECRVRTRGGREDTTQIGAERDAQLGFSGAQLPPVMVGTYEFGFLRCRAGGWWTLEESRGGLVGSLPRGCQIGGKSGSRTGEQTTPSSGNAADVTFSLTQVEDSAARVHGRDSTVSSLGGRVSLAADVSKPSSFPHAESGGVHRTRIAVSELGGPLAVFYDRADLERRCLAVVAVRALGDFLSAIPTLPRSLSAKPEACSSEAHRADWGPGVGWRTSRQDGSDFNFTERGSGAPSGTGPRTETVWPTRRICVVHAGILSSPEDALRFASYVRGYPGRPGRRKTVPEPVSGGGGSPSREAAIPQGKPLRDLLPTDCGRPAIDGIFVYGSLPTSDFEFDLADAWLVMLQTKLREEITPITGKPLDGRDDASDAGRSGMKGAGSASGVENRGDDAGGARSDHQGGSGFSHGGKRPVVWMASEDSVFGEWMQPDLGDRQLGGREGASMSALDRCLKTLFPSSGVLPTFPIRSAGRGAGESGTRSSSGAGRVSRCSEVLDGLDVLVVHQSKHDVEAAAHTGTIAPGSVAVGSAPASQGSSRGAAQVTSRPPVMPHRQRFTLRNRVIGTGVCYAGPPPDLTVLFSDEAGPEDGGDGGASGSAGALAGDHNADASSASFVGQRAHDSGGEPAVDGAAAAAAGGRHLLDALVPRLVETRAERLSGGQGAAGGSARAGGEWSAPDVLPLRPYTKDRCFWVCDIELAESGGPRSSCRRVAFSHDEDTG